MQNYKGDNTLLNIVLWNYNKGDGDGKIFIV